MLPPPGSMSDRMACTRFSPAGVSKYSVILRPPKLIRGLVSRLTTSPLGAWNSEPTEMPSASHSRISEATETLARSRSSLDTKPLVSPACSATSAMVIRAASRAAFSWAPIRVPSGTDSGIASPPPIDVSSRDRFPGIPVPYETPESFMKQGLTYRKPISIIAREAGHILEAAMATQSREPTAETEQEGGLLGQIEVHSIDWIPDTERHGKVSQQTMLWFLGNFQYFTIPIGFVGPALGLSLG